MEDVNGNEMCTDGTLWDILCEICAAHLVLLCDCLFSYILSVVSTEKGKSRNVSDISTVNRIDTERTVKGDLCVFLRRIF